MGKTSGTMFECVISRLALGGVLVGVDFQLWLVNEEKFQKELSAKNPD